MAHRHTQSKASEDCEQHINRKTLLPKQGNMQRRSRDPRLFGRSFLGCTGTWAEGPVNEIPNRIQTVFDSVTPPQRYDTPPQRSYRAPKKLQHFYLLTNRADFMSLRLYIMTDMHPATSWWHIESLSPIGQYPWEELYQNPSSVLYRVGLSSERSSEQTLVPDICGWKVWNSGTSEQVRISEHAVPLRQRERSLWIAATL